MDDDKACQKCNKGCRTCNGPNENDCTSCEDGYEGENCKTASLCETWDEKTIEGNDLHFIWTVKTYDTCK